MKRAITVFLVAIMLLSIPVEVFAEVPDFSAMSDEEIHELIDLARNELTKRELSIAENVVLFEQNGVTVYLTGEYNEYGSDNKYVDLFAVVINDSDLEISVGFNSATLNGWDVYGSGITDITAHHKKKGSLTFNLTDADISSYEEIEDIIFSLYIFDSSEYETVADIEPITVHFN